MADPLSIAAGVAGLLSLGIQVTQYLTEFYTSVKDQTTDVANLVQNLEDLLAVFRSLHVTIQERRSQPSEQELHQAINTAVQNCHQIIKELQGECLRFQRGQTMGLQGQVQLARRRVAYPFRKSTLQKLEEDIGEIREHLSFTLEVLHLRSSTHIEDGIQELSLLLERINTTQFSSSIRDWLMAPDATENHNAACAKRHTRTGLWFLKSYHFTTWLMECNSLLWINGFAGCGKSVLCSTAIQHISREMRDRHSVAIAFFYFSFDDKSKQSASGMLRALLLQLSAQLQGVEKELEQLHTSYKSGTPPLEALLAYIKRILNRFGDCYILIDAIDESPRGREREAVLRVLQTIRNWSLPSLHLIVTSRDELDIRKSLDPSPDQNIVMKSSDIDKDIVKFVSYQLSNEPKLQRWKARHEDIEVKLTTMAGGIFRYVECQFNALKRARNRNQLDECLRSLPRDLDATYERLLCNIDEMYIEDVRRILTLLCFSTRPLTVDELIDAHAIDLGDPPHLDRDGRLYELDDLIDICLGLVETSVIKDDSGRSTSIARIAHFSVQEYLESSRILHQKAARFAIQPGSGNAEIAQICLVYLLEPMLFAENFDETKLKHMPLTLFSAMHWYYHFTNSGEEKSRLEGLVLRLFQDEKNSFVTWVRLFDMDSPRHADVDMASPVYYASLLGLGSILYNITIDAVGGTSSEKVNKRGGRLGSPLQAASHGGHQECVQILLDRSADVDDEGGAYGSALAAASSQGHEKVVQILLDCGANANLKGGMYGSALSAACYGRHGQVVRMLLDHGADVNIEDGIFGGALQAASYGGQENLVQMLLDRGADVNTQSGRFGSALEAASSGGYEKVVQILLDNGANVNADDGPYGGALPVASSGGFDKVVQMLLDRGADVNAQGGFDGNALEAASFRGHGQVVRMLLDHGADVNIKDGIFGGALQAASYGGQENVVQMLLDRGADVNTQGGFYGNALKAASSRGHEKVVQILLDRGANVNTQGGFYGNALKAASSRGHEKVVQILPDRFASSQH
ncbi:hypothetical protein N7493_005490 [Penicillium malachiteum]|uniref:NACHT domain-containing protein n=1 Tax=Penicillium malachiteum TaxID=1324776 RepID=A0AAD6HNA0_9EURO|nr:hypothetical protein N7493_005490 [Penicillium malachiteum]